MDVTIRFDNPVHNFNHWKIKLLEQTYSSTSILPLTKLISN